MNWRCSWCITTTSWLVALWTEDVPEALPLQIHWLLCKLKIFLMHYHYKFIGGFVNWRCSWCITITSSLVALQNEDVPDALPLQVHWWLCELKMFLMHYHYKFIGCFANWRCSWCFTTTSSLVALRTEDVFDALPLQVHWWLCELKMFLMLYHYKFIGWFANWRCSWCITTTSSLVALRTEDVPDALPLQVHWWLWELKMFLMLYHYKFIVGFANWRCSWCITTTSSLVDLRTEDVSWCFTTTSSLVALRTEDVPDALPLQVHWLLCELKMFLMHYHYKFINCFVNWRCVFLLHYHHKFIDCFLKSLYSWCITITR